MKPEIQNLEGQIAGSSWISSVEVGAGIFLLNGRTHLAGHSSPAERMLLDRGALLVASVRFDRDPGESYRADHTVRVMEPDAAVRVLSGTPQRS